MWNIMVNHLVKFIEDIKVQCSKLEDMHQRSTERHCLTTQYHENNTTQILGAPMRLGNNIPSPTKPLIQRPMFSLKADNG